SGVATAPFSKIDIVPEAFQRTINQESGKIDFEFKAKFLFSAGSIYKAPPLMKREEIGIEENCSLVGVAKVDLIDDFFMNSFFALLTECLADLNNLNFCLILKKRSSSHFGH
ncbi:hypothetical protein S245_053723, partial [Arachis hypogaea]